MPTSSSAPAPIDQPNRQRSGRPTPQVSETEYLPFGSVEQSPVLGEAMFATDDDGTALQNAVDDLNRAAQIFDRRFEFRIHEATNRVIVDVYDRGTDELIRQIPPEKILDAVAKMQELLGLLFDERV